MVSHLPGRVHRQGLGGGLAVARLRVCACGLRGCGPALGCEEGDDLADGGFPGAGPGHRRRAWIRWRLRRPSLCLIT